MIAQQLSAAYLAPQGSDLALGQQALDLALVLVVPRRALSWW
jgi:hypothetical protein